MRAVLYSGGAGGSERAEGRGSVCRQIVGKFDTYSVIASCSPFSGSCIIHVHRVSENSVLQTGKSRVPRSRPRHEFRMGSALRDAPIVQHDNAIRLAHG